MYEIVEGQPRLSGRLDRHIWVYYDLYGWIIAKEIVEGFIDNDGFPVRVDDVSRYCEIPKPNEDKE
jgi:hypothetical protein